MGWTFPWVSSHGNDFNFDYHVSFRPEELKRKEALYNYTTIDPGIDELPGCSVFCKDEQGVIYHTYSSYARGGEEVIGAFMRSEEHTSELQSLMRISYAVFCLKKKNTK